MELKGLQLFVTNLNINRVFLSALDFMKIQYKIQYLFSVPWDAAPQPADVALLS